MHKWSDVHLWTEAAPCQRSISIISMLRIVTCDEICIYGYDPETKRQSFKWKSFQENKVLQEVGQATSSMLEVFFHIHCVVYHEVIPRVRLSWPRTTGKILKFGLLVVVVDSTFRFMVKSQKCTSSGHTMLGTQVLMMIKQCDLQLLGKKVVAWTCCMNITVQLYVHGRQKYFQTTWCICMWRHSD